MKRTLLICVFLITAVLFLTAAQSLLNLSNQVSGILSVANGGSSSTNTTAALTAGTTVAMDFSNTAIIYTLTPAQTETINASNCATGVEKILQITTSGTTSFTLTFSTNFRSTGTLATGTTTAKVFNVRFMCNGTTAYEVSRTGAE